MIKKILKGIIITLLVLIGLLFLFNIGSGGLLYDFGKLENSLLEYYSNDDSYELFSGEILSINDYTEHKHFVEGDVKFGFGIKMLNTINGWPIGTELEFQVFFGENWTQEQIKNAFHIGDIIVFKTATMSFYNGQISPIVYIEKDGEVYLEFNEGKNSLLEWVKSQKWTVLG